MPHGGELIVENIGVVGAVPGERLMSRTAMFAEQVEELTWCPEPLIGSAGPAGLGSVRPGQWHVLATSAPARRG